MPTSQEIKAARKAAGLTQWDAIRLVRPNSRTPRTWLSWERTGNIPPDAWELFMIKTKAMRKSNKGEGNGPV